MKALLLRAAEPIKKVTDSIFCMVAINIFVVLCWLVNLPIIGFAVFLLYFILVLLTQKNLNAILPFLASIAFVIGTGDENHSAPIMPAFVDTLYIVMACVAPIFVAALVWFFVRNKPQINAGKFSHGIIIFFAAALFGGLGTEYFTFTHFLTLVAWFLALYLIYLFFYNTLDFEDPKFKKFFALSFFASALAVVAELFIAYILSGDFFGNFSRSPTIGWGKGPAVAQVLTMYIPFAFYLVTKSKTKKEVILYNVSIIILLLALFLTRSRAGLLAMAVAIIPLIVITHLKLVQNQKKTNLITWLAFAAVGILLAAIFHTKVFALIEKVLRGFTLTGRDFLWSEGWAAFKESPIFGKSFFFVGDFNFGTVEGFIFMYWFHNTVVQVFANLGLVGVIAFGYLMFKKYQVFFKKGGMGGKLGGKNCGGELGGEFGGEFAGEFAGEHGDKGDSINFFILISLAVTEIMSLFDIHTFAAIYIVFMLLFMAGAEHWQQEKKVEIATTNTNLNKGKA